MVYLEELRHFNQFNRSNLQTFNEKRRFSSYAPLGPYWRSYCNNSSLHCVRYLTDAKMQNYEKAIWLLIILVTFFAAVCVYVELSVLYETRRIQTTVDDSVYPVYYIPFPAVGICTRHRINWTKIKDAHQRFLPKNASLETVKTFDNFFKHFENFRFGKFGIFADLLENDSGGEAGNHLELIDNVSILNVMEFLSFTCDEVFANGTCVWRKQNMECCELFNLERTELGFCHVFNSVIDSKSQLRAKDDKYFPYHNSKAGEGTGLKVEIKLDETKIRSDSNVANGVFVMIKQPQQWTDSAARFVNSNTYSKVAIRPQLTNTTKATRGVTPQKRNCIFDDEDKHPLYKKIHGLQYWRANCRTQCHKEYILKYCNCTIDLVFPQRGNNYTECKPSDYKCLYRNELLFRNERHIDEEEYIDDRDGEKMVCNCLKSCNALMLESTITSYPLESSNLSNTIKKIRLDVHYQAEFMLKYKTHMAYTFVELIANFGGIIGLFLGASLLSAVEIVYFLTIGLFAYLRREQEHNENNVQGETSKCRNMNGQTKFNQREKF